MKIILFLSVVTAVVVAQRGIQPMQAVSNTMMGLATGCTEIEDLDVLNLPAGQVPDDETTRRFLYCAASATGFLDEDDNGNMDEDNGDGLLNMDEGNEGSLMNTGEGNQGGSSGLLNGLPLQGQLGGLNNVDGLMNGLPLQGQLGGLNNVDGLMNGLPLQGQLRGVVDRSPVRLG